MFAGQRLGEEANVYVRLLISRSSPGLPKREGYVEIWIMGTKFRVLDKTGRYFSEILGDLAAARGLGQIPQTIEGIMDVRSRFRDRSDFDPIEIVGDTSKKTANVLEVGKTPWTLAVEKVAPVVEQIFTRGLVDQLEQVKTLTRFDRTCTKYKGVVSGEEGGIPFENKVTLIVSPPYVFLNKIQDAQRNNFYYLRKTVDFREGSVTENDLFQRSSSQ